MGQLVILIIILVFAAIFSLYSKISAKRAEKQYLASSKEFKKNALKYVVDLNQSSVFSNSFQTEIISNNKYDGLSAASKGELSKAIKKDNVVSRISTIINHDGKNIKVVSPPFYQDEQSLNILMMQKRILIWKNIEEESYIWEIIE